MSGQQETDQGISDQSPSLVARLGEMLDFERGGSGRLYFWQSTLGVIVENPILGVGYNGLYNNANRYYPLKWLQMMHAAGNERRAISSHNKYLDIAAETGLVGLIIFLWLISTFMGILWRQSNLLVLAIIAAWAGYLVHLFFLYDTIDSLVIAWALMGLGVAACRREDDRIIERRFYLGQPGSVIVCLIAATAGVWLMYTAFAALRSGMLIYDAGRQSTFSAASRLYLQAAELNPNSERIQVEVAGWFFRSAERTNDAATRRRLLDEAIRLYDRAIALDPRTPYLYYERGEVYAAYGTEPASMAKAYTDFKTAVDYYPNYYQANGGLADTARMLGRRDEAIEAEERMLAIAPGNRKLMGILADDYLAVSKDEQAAQLRRQMLGGD